jgi:hypothetical protein
MFPPLLFFFQGVFAVFYVFLGTLSSSKTSGCSKHAVRRSAFSKDGDRVHVFRSSVSSEVEVDRYMAAETFASSKVLPWLRMSAESLPSSKIQP